MIQVKCEGLASGLMLDDDSTPSLTVTGTTEMPVMLPPRSVVEVSLTIEHVAALAVMAAKLDPVSWVQAFATEFDRARQE